MDYRYTGRGVPGSQAPANVGLALMGFLIVAAAVAGLFVLLFAN